MTRTNTQIALAADGRARQGLVETSGFLASKAVGMISLAETRMRDVNWLWKDWIPFGKLTLISGDAGVGKSLLTLDIAARYSTGRDFPDGSPPGGEGNVLLMTAEDSPEDMLLPRLKAAEADVQKINVWTSKPDGKSGLPQPILFPDDLEDLRATIERTKMGLVIIDPISDFLAQRVNSWSDPSMRRVLTPLAGIAEQTGAAIVIVGHLNKKDVGPNPLYRVVGSIAQVSAARSAVIVARTPDDEEQRIVACIKTNLVKKPTSFLYHVETVKVEGITEKVARVSYDGATDIHIEEALQPAGAQTRGRQGRVKEPSKAERARDFLVKRLAPGEVVVYQLKEEAAAQGIDGYTLEKAKECLEVESIPVDGGRIWRLPKKQPTPNVQSSR